MGGFVVFTVIEVKLDANLVALLRDRGGGKSRPSTVRPPKWRRQLLKQSHRWTADDSQVEGGTGH